MAEQGITLADGELTLQLLPELGAALASLRHRGRDVLRPAPPGTRDPFQTAAFVLAPFANRIAGGRLRVGGEVRIERNAPGQAHPLHGHAWRQPWQVRCAERAHAELLFEHPRDSWPWHYAVTQTLTLRAGSLEVRLTLENRDCTAMPAGLGWHPYFHKGQGARLEARLQGVWLTDEEMLPVRLEHGTPLGQWGRGDALAQPQLIDHCHTGWDGLARIVLPEERLRLTLSASPQLKWLHIFSAPDLDYFCIEPVSHIPDAVNRLESPVLTGHRLLAPGERFEASVRLGVVNSDN